jgi:hypothetical protein
MSSVAECFLAFAERCTLPLRCLKEHLFSYF